MPACAPIPCGSTRSATSLPSCSTHQTPSSGTADCLSFTKLKPANTTAATVSRNSSTATKRAWLSRFMDFVAFPKPFGGGRVDGTSRCSVISKFAATRAPVLATLSPIAKSTSEIIDANSNANYAFWKVYVGFSIRFPFKICRLGRRSSFRGFPFSQLQELTYSLRFVEFPQIVSDLGSSLYYLPSG